MAKLKAETDDDSPEGNALIERLKKQSEDNREINELIIQQKTFMNDKVSFCRKEEGGKKKKEKR